MPTSATSLYPTAYKELCFHPRLQPRTPSRVRPAMTVMGSDRHSWLCVTKHTAATFSVTFPHPVVPACCDVSHPVWVSLRSECRDLSFWTFPGGAWAKPLLTLVYFFSQESSCSSSVFVPYFSWQFLRNIRANCSACGPWQLSVTVFN